MRAVRMAKKMKKNKLLLMVKQILEYERNKKRK